MENPRPYIAVVDDDPSVRKSLLRLLRTIDMDSSAFSCGEDVIQSLSQRQPDCLLLDINMPGMDGLQVRDRLYSLGFAIPVVFLTALDDGATRQRALAGGAAAFLQKPMNDKELEAAIASATGSHDPGRGGEILQSESIRVPFEEARIRSSKPSFRIEENDGLLTQLVHEIGRLVDEREELKKEKRIMESALDLMGTRLVDSIEQERSRIARELHDDLCQRMALVAIGLEQLAQTKGLPQHEISRRIRLLWKDIASICSDTGRLSRELHSAKLEQLGLIPAVRSLCADVSQRNGIAVDFSLKGTPELVSKEGSVCLFRIAQEALGNAAKHGHPSVVRVELSWGAEGVTLCISDDGVGFDPVSVEEKGRLGLVSMRERARIIGGEISIMSRPSGGTHIKVRLPLNMLICS